MSVKVVNLARLGQKLIAQEIGNGRGVPSLHFLLETFEEIEKAAGGEREYSGSRE